MNTTMYMLLVYQKVNESEKYNKIYKTKNVQKWIWSKRYCVKVSRKRFLSFIDFILTGKEFQICGNLKKGKFFKYVLLVNGM